MIEVVGADAAELLGALHARAFDKPWTTAEVAKLLQNDAVFAVLARAGEPYGFGMGWAVAGDAELLTVAIVPEARRRGLGAALVDAVAATALARGAASLHLEVAEDNAAARSLYAKLGFAEAGRRKGYYASGGGFVDAIVMKRTLP